MEQRRSQTVRFGDKTVQIQTVMIDGIECLCLKDVQRQFPLVTALCIDNVQLAFIKDDRGNDLEPLHVEASKDQIIEAVAPTASSIIDFHDHFSRLHANIDELKIPIHRIDANTQEILNQMRYVMTQMYELHEFTTPRYFFILPAKHHDWTAINAVKNLFHVHYKLYFLCECSDEPKELHIAPHDGYSIKKPKEFIVRYGPYLRTTLSVIRVLLTLGGVVIPQLGNVSTVVNNSVPLFLKSSTNFDSMTGKVDFVQNLLDTTDSKLIRAASSMYQQGKSQGTPLQGADLRELESYLELVDSKHTLGNLYRIVTGDGHVRWVCLEHYNAISFTNKMSEYISQLQAIGVQFNQENTEALLTQVNLTSKNVKILFTALKKGSSITKLVFEKCSIYEGDLDTLLDVIINRSSIRCLIMAALDVRNWIGKSKYVCQYVVIHSTNQSFKVRFYGHYHNGNTPMLVRLLLQNKICRTLDFSACDFLEHEEELQRCLDTNGMLKGLIVKYSNNIDVLNAISTFKNNTLEQLKLNYSLCLPSTTSHFCEMLKINQTLVEIDIMDSIVFDDETFINDLLGTLRAHKSIKHLSLHVCDIKPSDQKEVCLVNSLLYDKFISRLCLSKSVISPKFTQALVYASREHRSLTYLEFYDTQINADDISELQSLHNDEILMHLIFSEQPRWHLVLEETRDGFKKEQFYSFTPITFHTKWKQLAITIAGGKGHGQQLNELSCPTDIAVADDQTLFIADQGYHRIMEWSCNATIGRIVAGGHGPGNQTSQLHCPTEVIVDEENHSLVIADWRNRRVMQWSRQHWTEHGEILLSDIDCRGLTMDKKGSLYTSDWKKHEVRRYRRGEKEGTIVAGGNGKGDQLRQLNFPTYIFVDQDESLYVSDINNHRVMKWRKDVKEGIVVAGGNGQGQSLRQLSSPEGVLVDPFGQIYVADRDNHRVMRWCEGAKEGTIVVGGNGHGQQSNQFHSPTGLSFDCKGNLYVVDCWNHRIQKFEMN